jgi:hypothetical protein
MKKTVYSSEFCNEMTSNGFTWDGAKALFDYIEEYEGDTGEEVEFDAVALRCEYTEYADLEEIQANYSDIDSIDDLRDNTIVIEFDSGIIIADF